MGRNSGGITSSGKGGSSGGSKGATEKGYTAKMVKNIVGMEQKYRRNKDETLHVFNSKGDIVSSIGGKGAQVVFDPKKIPANSILTHNHPRSLGESGIRRIGNSFSSDDIRSAIRVNAKEMRAVTPTYTFSIKRPKGGWACRQMKRQRHLRMRIGQYQNKDTITSIKQSGMKATLQEQK